jgi:hypothetical protein
MLIPIVYINELPDFYFTFVTYEIAYHSYLLDFTDSSIVC